MTANWKGIDDRVGFWLIRHDRTRGVSARSVLMADVKDANATPDTVSVSLHDTNLNHVSRDTTTSN